jgi:hypothetical protein
MRPESARPGLARIAPVSQPHAPRPQVPGQLSFEWPPALMLFAFVQDGGSHDLAGKAPRAGVSEG